ncbi:acyl carrier protein [Catellatospora bangladeshensis]|uniref:Acyl carrier protein n=1 Tax=Catellatospora bangladeshensis TaxID=310355 RepID=A0A8J3NLC1_9ACTN|nr:acyl carrier protein [Catellatospora bangladeshensis]GIF83666.1 hypothetical protein Cba03nite_50150 [Catellatospora bangladeshensis]
MIAEVRKTVIDGLAQMNYDVSDVTGDTVLGPEGLDLESLAIAELAILLEDTYGSKFTEEEMSGFTGLTIDQIAGEVTARTAVGASA